MRQQVVLFETVALVDRCKAENIMCQGSEQLLVQVAASWTPMLHVMLRLVPCAATILQCCLPSCREALGELSGAPGAGAARNIQLLLLRYQFLDSYACPPGQQQYLLHLMGKGPAPPGFERQRRGGAAGSEGGDGAGQDDRNAGRGGDGWSPAVPGERDMRGGAGPPSALPPLLDRFLSMLPAPEYLDGPVPDLNLVVDTLLGMPDDEHGGAVGGGVKRELEGDEHDMGGGPGRDIFRMRAKQRARLAAGDA